MWHLLFGVNGFFRFASKKPDQHAAFFRPRRAVLRRGTNYSKARFWNARGGAHIFSGSAYFLFGTATGPGAGKSTIEEVPTQGQSTYEVARRGKLDIS
jgi:hypothetical protein